MGFLADFDMIADEIITEYAGGASRVKDRVKQERYVATQACAAIQECFKMYVGANSQKYGLTSSQSSYSVEYDDQTGVIEIFVAQKVLGRYSLNKKNHDPNALSNVISLISTGYAQLSGRPRGIWRERYIKALPQRDPNKRYNYYGEVRYKKRKRKTKSAASSSGGGWTVVTAGSRTTDIHPSLSELLDNINAIVQKYGLNATITLDDSFGLPSGESPVRVSLHNASDTDTP